MDLEVMNLRLEIMHGGASASGEGSEAGQFRVLENTNLIGRLRVAAAGIRCLGADYRGGNYRERTAAGNCLRYP